MLSREQYVTIMRDLLNRDPNRDSSLIRDANRQLYTTVVESSESQVDSGLDRNTEADLVLAEIASI